MDAQRGNPVRRSAGTRDLMSAQPGFFKLGHSGTPGKSGMPGKFGKIQILRRNGSSGRQMTKIQLKLRNMLNILPHTGWFKSQDKYSVVNDSIKGSTSVFRPQCASMAHRPRAPARVDRRRTQRKSDVVQMAFSRASQKNIDFLSEKSLFLSCLGPACCVFFVRVCLCVSVRVSVCACVSLCVTPVCPFKTSACTAQRKTSEKPTNTGTREHERRDTSPQPKTTDTQRERERETTPDTRDNATKKHETCDQSHTRQDKTRRDRRKQDETRQIHIHIHIHIHIRIHIHIQIQIQIQIQIHVHVHVHVHVHIHVHVHVHIHLHIQIHIHIHIHILIHIHIYTSTSTSKYKYININIFITPVGRTIADHLPVSGSSMVLLTLKPEVHGNADNRRDNEVRRPCTAQGPRGGGRGRRTTLSGPTGQAFHATRGLHRRLRSLRPNLHSPKKGVWGWHMKCSLQL